MNHKINIIGGPGSAKSFAAMELSRRFGVPAYDLDDLFWDSSAPQYGIPADAAERDRRLAAIVAEDGWIIEGVYYSWLAPSFNVADIVIALTPSLWVRDWRVIRRFVARKLGHAHTKRESVADLWRLLRWSHAYDKTQLVKARNAVAACGRQIVACKTLGELLT